MLDDRCTRHRGEIVSTVDAKMGNDITCLRANVEGVCPRERCLSEAVMEIDGCRRGKVDVAKVN